MVYNCDFEIFAILIEIITLFYAQKQYAKNVEGNKKFVLFMRALLVATVLDVLAALCINYLPDVNTHFHMIFNSLYFVSAAVAGYYFFLYVERYIEDRLFRKQVINHIFNTAILVLIVILYIVNYSTHWLFWFEEHATYMHGPLYYLVYLPFAYYVADSVGLLAIYRKQYSKSQIYSIAMFVLLWVSGFLIQAFGGTSALVTYAFGSVAALIMLFTLETPDYQRVSTLMKELEQERTMRMNGELSRNAFLTNAAEELRGPVNGVLGMNDMILEGTKDKQLQEYASNVELAGKTLLGMVNNIADLAKMESGSMVIAKEKYNLANVLGECYKLVHIQAEEKKIKLVFENNETIPKYLVGDELRILQVIGGLLQNAVRFTTNGDVVVSVDYEDVDETTLMLKVAVRDSGVGIREEDITRILGNFLNDDDGVTRRIRGSGLGLCTMQLIVQHMGGTLTVDSTYGEGSVFRIRIPQGRTSSEEMGNVWDAYVASQDEYTVHLKSFTAPKASILVVDDIAMDAKVVKGMLRLNEIEVESALSGDEALEMAAKKKYDLILLDHLMPVVDGIETLQRLRRASGNQNIDTPVIAFTSNASVGARSYYIENGFTDYLAKPIHEGELSKLLIKYIPEEMILWKEQSKDSMSHIVLIPGKVDETPEKVEDEGGKAEEAKPEKINSEKAESEKKGASSSGLTEGEILEKMSFLDVKSGLTFCGGMEKFYVDMLRKFVKKDVKESLEKHHESQDFVAYIDVVHGLRSSAKVIGAQELVEEAKQIEAAAEKEDMDYINSRHMELMESYSALLDMMREILE